jgi:hypothetical protein
LKFFTVLGVIFAIVGAFFLFQAIQPSSVAAGSFDVDVTREAAPILALVFLPMGIIFTAVGLLVGRSMGNRQKLIEQGIAGQATVMSAAETGMYVNERPMVRLTLNVSVPGRLPYTVEHREVIPFIALGMITPGSTLAVAVDTIDPKKLAIDWSGETRARAMGPVPGSYGAPPAMPASVPMPNTLSTMGSAMAAPNTLQPQAPGIPQGQGMPAPMGPNPTVMTSDVSQLYGAMAQTGIAITQGTAVGQPQTMTISTTGGGDIYQAQLAALRDSGLVGRAVIKSVEDLGVVIQGDKVERFELDVTPNGGPMYSVQHSGFVPAPLAHRAVAGAGVVVHIDRANPQNVVIDWAAG